MIASFNYVLIAYCQRPVRLSALCCLTNVCKCLTTVPLLTPYILEVEWSKINVKDTKMSKSFLAVTPPHVVRFNYFMERLQCFNSGGGFRGMLAVRRTEDFLVINKTV